MEPGLNFGEPTVEGTPYRAVTLKEAAEAEDSAECAARIYNVEETDIIIAIEALEKNLGLQEAA